MIFVGYDDKAKAYRCYGQLYRKLVISCDVRFVDGVTANTDVSIDTETIQNPDSLDVQLSLSDNICGRHFDFRKQRISKRISKMIITIQSLLRAMDQ